MTRILGVQLEFTHAIGPTPGLYVVHADEARAVGVPEIPHMNELFGITRGEASADVLGIAVTEAPAATRSFAQLIGRRQTATAEAGEARTVSILTATYAFASRPFEDDRAGQAAYMELRSDPDKAVPLVEHALRIVNRAIAAFRTAAEDPYVIEVAPEDPRVVRIVLATPDQMRKADWTDGFALAGPRRRSTTRLARAAALRPSEAVAAALASAAQPDPVDHHLLRAQLDLEHGRIASALAELRLTLQFINESAVRSGTAELERALLELDAGSSGAADTESMYELTTRVWSLIDGIRARERS
jgi:hypothetical protein